jgi:Fusaric acid resistance protein family
MTAQGRVFMRVYDAQRLKTALRAVAPPLLFGFRLWASVCLALYVAFWLELDNAFWAGYTAVTVSQPRLGASGRSPTKRLWIGQAARPSSWKTPFIATRMAL